MMNATEIVTELDNMDDEFLFLGYWPYPRTVKMSQEHADTMRAAGYELAPGERVAGTMFRYDGINPDGETVCKAGE